MWGLDLESKVKLSGLKHYASGELKGFILRFLQQD